MKLSEGQRLRSSSLTISFWERSIIILLLVALHEKAGAINQRVIAEFRYNWQGEEGCLSLAPISPEHPIQQGPLLAGVDWQGRIYLVDPIYDKLRKVGALKIFDKRGEKVGFFKDKRFFDETAPPFFITATHAGHVWIGNCPGKPLRRASIALWGYQLSTREKIFDFYEKIPLHLNGFLSRVLGKGWFNSFSSAGPAWVEDVIATEDKVIIHLWQKKLVRELKSGVRVKDRIIRLVMSCDGKMFYKGEVVKCWGEESIIDPNGKEWKLRIKAPCDKDGLLNLTQGWVMQIQNPNMVDGWRTLVKSSDLKRLLGSDTTPFPEVEYIDSRGQFYLVLSRQMETPIDIKFKLVNGPIISMEGRTLYALAVVDSSGKLLHWQGYRVVPYFLRPTNWIRPLLDGKGYYELRLLYSQAQVILHTF